jgi:glutamate transport system permease protein
MNDTDSQRRVTKPGLLVRLTTPPAPRPGELSLVEELGPKGRTKALSATLVFLALVVALFAWVIRRFQIKAQFAPELWRPFRLWGTWRFLLIGLANTLKAAAIAFVLAIVIGIAMSMWRTGPSKLGRVLSTIYVEGFRACALVLLVTFSFFQIPKVPGPFQDWSLFRYAFVALILGLTLYYSTVFAEVVRSSLRSLPKGQEEAGLAIGLSPGRVQRAILMPQALRRALPNLITQGASLLKDTSLGSLIVYPELLKSADIIGGFGDGLSPNQLQTYLVAGAMYVSVIAVFTSIANRLERRRVSSSR